MLAEYQGREEELWEVLEGKYGAGTLPAAVRSARAENFAHIRLIPRTTHEFNGALRAMLACGWVGGFFFAGSLA